MKLTLWKIRCTEDKCNWCGNSWKWTVYVTNGRPFVSPKQSFSYCWICTDKHVSNTRPKPMGVLYFRLQFSPIPEEGSIELGLYSKVHQNIILHHSHIISLTRITFRKTSDEICFAIQFKAINCVQCTYLSWNHWIVGESQKSWVISFFQRNTPIAWYIKGRPAVPLSYSQAKPDTAHI